MVDLSVFSQFNVEVPTIIAGDSSLLVPVRDDVRGITGRFLPDATGKTILTTKKWIVEGDIKDDEGKKLWIFADIDWGVPDLIGEYLAQNPVMNKQGKPVQPQTAYYSVYYIKKDDQYPANNARIMILPYSKAVYDKIVAARTSREPIEPFDVVNGANFFYVREAAKKMKSFGNSAFGSISDFTKEVQLEDLIEKLPVLAKDVKTYNEEEQKELLKTRFSNYNG
jgi:hypothetical protein